MATRKPLVLGSDGRPQQLQAGDTLGITSETGQISQTAAAALVAGAPVYTSAAGAVNKGRANAAGTSVLLGLCVTDIASSASGIIQLNGVLTLTTTQWDAITGQTGGLTAGTTYYLDPATAGKLTTTCPTTVGHLVVIVGKALSSTDFNITIDEPILL